MIISAKRAQQATEVAFPQQAKIRFVANFCRGQICLQKTFQRIRTRSGPRQFWLVENLNLSYFQSRWWEYRVGLSFLDTTNKTWKLKLVFLKLSWPQAKNNLLKVLAELIWFNLYCKIWMQSLSWKTTIL